MLNRLLLFTLALIFSSTLFAQSGLIELPVSRKAALFWLYNKSSQLVLINHPLGKDPGAQAGWASVINSGRWSILSLSKENVRGKKTFVLSCSTWSDGKKPIEPLDCSKVMVTGILRGTELPANFQSGFWFAENKSLLGLRRQFHYWKIPYPYLYFLYLKFKTL